MQAASPAPTPTDPIKKIKFRGVRHNEQKASSVQSVPPHVALRPQLSTNNTRKEPHVFFSCFLTLSLPLVLFTPVPCPRKSTFRNKPSQTSKAPLFRLHLHFFRRQGQELSPLITVSSDKQKTPRASTNLASIKFARVFRSS